VRPIGAIFVIALCVGACAALVASMFASSSVDQEYDDGVPAVLAKEWRAR
jgi:hypothetical protein